MEEAGASARQRKRPRPCEGDTGTSAAAAGAGDGEPYYYPYQPIAETLNDSSVDARGGVCLFAAVAEIGLAVHSSGTDYFVTLRIADESCKAGVSVTFFAEDTALLPCVKSNKDVISLHYVKIKKYKDDFCVLFNKKRSSFALFESQVSAECSPYQTSKKYHGSKDDKERLTNMRTWLPNNPLGLADLELQLRSLKSDSTFDLVCKVFHACEYNGKWIFYVWDGTDTPADEFQAMLDCRTYSSDAEAVESPTLLEEPPLSRKVLCTMPCVGTVMRIFSDSNFNKVRYMEKSIWVRFCNITCKQEFGVWKGISLPSSGVRLLSDVDDRVLDRLRMFGSRNTNRVWRQPMDSFPSNVAVLSDVCKKGHYSTLMGSLTHPQVTHIVKTLVRVVGAYPFRASEVRSLSKGESSILLTLEDPTARIHASVYKKDLVNFFNGSLAEEVIIKKMNKLLGVPEAAEVGPSLTRNPPWIWCCMKSYCVDEKNPWGSRWYQICGTTIRG